MLNGLSEKAINDLRSEGILQTIPKSLSHVQLFKFVQSEPNPWTDNLFVIKDFKTVTVDSSDVPDRYLRPVQWIARIPAEDMTKYVLVLFSQFECNRLLPIFKKSTKSVLYMYAPWMRENQPSLLDMAHLQASAIPEAERIPLTIEEKVQIGMYAGSKVKRNKMLIANS